MTEEEIERWLDRDPGDGPADTGAADEPLPVPPPPPRHFGVMVEAAVGGSSPLGALRYVSPTAPWFHLKVGYEPLRYLMMFAEGDFFIANTRFASRPPGPRTYAYYGFGGGLRATLPLGELVGILISGDLGAARATEDALVQYGYRDSDDLTLYYGGTLGLEIYPVNPHLTLALHAGVRSYTGLVREQSSDPSLNVLAGLAMKYAFF